MRRALIIKYTFPLGWCARYPGSDTIIRRSLTLRGLLYRLAAVK